jgi:ArsR family transcriptional regulator, arsenate/arsenite/antimonite-responsive transcriptional repressor
MFRHHGHHAEAAPDARHPDGLLRTAGRGAAVRGRRNVLPAGRLRAVAKPARLGLVSLVLAGAGQEVCIYDLTAPLGLTQPTVSHHMKVLVDAGLLTREKRGRWAYFRAVPQAFEPLAQALQPTAPS